MYLKLGGQSLWFQLDGAPAHYGEDVMSVWTWHPGRWMWHGRVVACPCLLDVTQMDFLHGHLTEHVYTAPSRTIKDLMARLQAAVTVVDANVLWNARTCCVAQCHLPWNGWRLFWIPTVTMRSPTVGSFDILCPFHSDVFLKTVYWDIHCITCLTYLLIRDHIM
jgi:hypothetical protein